MSQSVADAVLEWSLDQDGTADEDGEMTVFTRPILAIVDDHDEDCGLCASAKIDGGEVES